MGFKDRIQNDLDVFINPDEHAEVHVVKMGSDGIGKEIPVIIDSDALNNRPRQPVDLYNASNGVYTSSVTVQIKVSDLEYRPLIRSHFYLDDEFYLVGDCFVNMGMYTIVLEANEA